MALIPTSIRQQIHLTRTRWQRFSAFPERYRRRRWADTIRTEDAAAAPVSAEIVREPKRLADGGFSPVNLPADIGADLLETWVRLEEKHASDADPAGAKRTTGKAFFKERLSNEDLADFPAFLRAGLEPHVLTTVMDAMGMVPHLESIDIIESVPSQAKPSASQLWHYDVNDEHIIKLFVYLEDCADENGPFTFVDARDSMRVASAVGHYVDDAQLSKHVPSTDWQKVEGPAGTAFLIDTGRCYHFGSRCDRRRVALIVTYSSGLKFMPRADIWSSLVDRAALSQLQRAVCGVSA